MKQRRMPQNIIQVDSSIHLFFTFVLYIIINIYIIYIIEIFFKTNKPIDTLTYTKVIAGKIHNNTRAILQPTQSIG